MAVQEKNGIMAPMPGAITGNAGTQHLAPGITAHQLPNGGVAITNNQPQQAEAYNKDLTELHEDAAELQARQQALTKTLEMRNLALALPQTGSGGDTRAAIANYIHTYMPALENSWLTRAAKIPDAALAGEFAKLALVNAGNQEKDAVGARGGYRLIELYKNANPSLNQPQQLNVDVANLQAVAHQMDIDYLQGEQKWGAEKGGQYLSGQADYQPINNYDQQWMSQRNPQVYLGATLAMSGHPFAEWSKGLSKEEIGRALDVVKRVDSTSRIMGPDGKPHVFAAPPQ
jgi:hypothetical protein